MKIHTKGNKSILFIIFILFIIGLAYAIDYHVSSFYGETNPFNITFTGGDNHTYYLNVPRYSYVKNASISVTNRVNYSTCYKEFANISSCGGGEGVYYVGGSWCNNPLDGCGAQANITDGDYTSFSTSIASTAFLYVNYSKCAGKTMWQTKDDKEFVNRTIPYSCTNTYSDVTSYLITSDTVGLNVQIDYYCREGSTWKLLGSTSGGINLFYEEAQFCLNTINLSVNTSNMITKYNYPVNYSESKNISLNISEINTILSDDCDEGIISGDYCRIPIAFYSGTQGILEVNLTNATYTRYINFSLKREETLADFDVASHNVSLDVYCFDETVHKTITSNNFSQEFNCEWEMMKIIVSRAGSEYYRTLIPGYSENNITFYLLDLSLDTAIQTILSLNDLTGDYENGTIRVERIINSTEIEVIEQRFDAEGKVTLYLQKQARYTLSIISQDGTVRSIGYIVPEIAAEKTITVPDVEYVPDVILTNTVSWSWNLSTSTLASLYYRDTLGYTTNLNFTVYNGTDISKILYTTYASNLGTQYFSFVIPTNTSYVACFNATHQVLGTMSDCNIYVHIASIGNFTGWTPSEETSLKKWSAIIFSIFVCLLIGAIFPTVGLAMLSFLIWMFMKWNWVTFGDPIKDYSILSILVLITVLTFLARGFKL